LEKQENTHRFLKFNVRAIQTGTIIVGAHMLDVRSTINVSKAEVLSLDVRGVRRILDSVLADRAELERNRNNVAIYVLGYDNDSRELYLIPEVRKWFHRLFDEVPELFYWMNMRENFLVFYALMMQRPIKVEGGTIVSPEDMQQFLVWGYERLNLFCAEQRLNADATKSHISACLEG
jgi:hypothetical protein